MVRNAIESELWKLNNAHFSIIRPSLLANNFIKQNYTSNKLFLQNQLCSLVLSPFLSNLFSNNLYCQLNQVEQMKQRYSRQSPQKCLNQLALLQQQSKREKEQLQIRQILKYKMRAINQIAQSDIDFQPDLPVKDKQENRSTCFQQISIENISNTQKKANKFANPEDYFQNFSGKSQFNQQDKNYITQPSSMEKSIILRVGNDYFHQTALEYCYDCDSTYANGNLHICFSSLVNIQQINDKLNKLSNLSEIALTDKFAIFIDTALSNRSSEILKSTLMILKAGKSATFNPFQLLVKKRLVNLMSKKIGLALEQEDEE